MTRWSACTCSSILNKIKCECFRLYLGWELEWVVWQLLNLSSFKRFWSVPWKEILKAVPGLYTIRWICKTKWASIYNRAKFLSVLKSAAFLCFTFVSNVITCFHFRGKWYREMMYMWQISHAKEDIGEHGGQVYLAEVDILLLEHLTTSMYRYL